MINILIPFKKHSVRCPNKNFILFPYIIKYLNEYKNNITILTEDLEVINFISQYNIKYWYNNVPYSSDLNICYNYAIKYQLPYFFMFPLTQPFKDLNFIDNALQYIDDYDLICSTVLTSERSRYYITNNSFQIPNIERKGSLCNTNEMIDGSMYLIKTEFLKTCIDNNDISNVKFWNSCKLKTILCNHPYFDIDTKYDMWQFKFVVNYMNKQNI